MLTTAILASRHYWKYRNIYHNGMEFIRILSMRSKTNSRGNFPPAKAPATREQHALQEMKLPIDHQLLQMERDIQVQSDSQ